MKRNLGPILLALIFLTACGGAASPLPLDTPAPLTVTPPATATPVPPTAVPPSPTATPVLPTAPPAPTPAPTATRVSLDEIVAGLEDLPWDDFLEQSYRQLQLRDPDALWINGLAPAYGVPKDRFTDISDAYLRETQQLETALLGLLHRYDRSTLPPDQQLSYDVYEWYLDDRVQGQPFMYYDYPVNPLTIWGRQNWVIDLLVNHQPIADRRDAEDYIARLSEIDTWVAQLIEGLRLREQAGIVPPRYVVESSLRQVEDHLHPLGPDSYDVERIAPYASFRDQLNQAQGISTADRESLLAAARVEIEKTFVPAFLALRDYLAHLVTVAGDEPGVGQFPQGAAYYDYLLQHSTGLVLDADELHDLGRVEVARVQAELLAAAAELGYPPELAELDARLTAESEELSGDALQAEYRRLITAADLACDAFFDLRPAAEVVIREDPFGSGIAYYLPPSLDGSGPGVFYTNLDLTLPRYILPTFVFHETVPGHHLQGALTRELDLSTFQQTLEINGYIEGWAVYAERLAWEMGLYEGDPLGNLGRLQFELSRAARLVVDTGMHAKGWSREEAAAYYTEATGSPASPESMDRYVILPGQGCGYTVGMLKILELRQRAMDELGAAFDIKAFHDVVLGHGPLPLSILERVVDAWIADQGSGR
jgi:uncharacterized protein (DUF885 family)